MARKSARPKRKKLRAPSAPGGDRGTADLGPPERWARGALALEETAQAGVRRARARYECLLDLLFARGELGEAQAARRRYDAGLWLRQLYQRTHDEVATQRFDALGRDQAEMSDEDAAALDLYRRTLLALGPGFGVLRRVCCDDRPAPADGRLPRALDRLADWRGM